MVGLQPLRSMLAEITAALIVLQPPDWILIPALGISIPVVESEYGVKAPSGRITWDFSFITDEAGWLDTTAEPGEGNTVIGAHNPGPFSDVRTLEEGTQVIVHEGHTYHIYNVVDSYRVWATDTRPTEETDDPQLTLLTCTERDDIRQVVVLTYGGEFE